VRRALVVAVAMGLVTTVAIVVQALALAHVLGALFHDPRAGLGGGVALFLAATGVRALAVALAGPVTARIAAPLRRELRRRSLARVLEDGPMTSVDATVQLATRGVDAIEGYVANYVPSLVLATLAPVLLLGWLAATDLWSFVIVAVCVCLLPIFMALLGLAAQEKMESRWREQQQLAGYFGDLIRGMTVLKSFNRSRDALANLDEVGDALQRTTMDTLRVAFMSSFALELLSSLATALVALVLGLRLINGSLALSVALAVLLVTPEVFLPLRRSAAQFHSSSEGIGAATDLLSRLEVPSRTGVAPAPVDPPSIEFRDVTASHVGRAGGARPLRASVAAGSLVTIVGPSGSGKSTLLRALCGLRRLDEGLILIDGVDLASIDLADWQRRVAWMPQDPALPGDTVRDAVTMGAVDVDDARILAAMAEVGLDLDLDLALGEGAGVLSAGQRRRLALVRALVRRPLLLVLDEPTSHLDETSARLVHDVIARLSMTRVVATHRDFEADARILLDPAVPAHD
jgi:ATP-binding cassette subfamily C protein CydCD